MGVSGSGGAKKLNTGGADRPLRWLCHLNAERVHAGLHKDGAQRASLQWVRNARLAMDLRLYDALATVGL